jgi:hypothetical protein
MKEIFNMNTKDYNLEAAYCILMQRCIDNGDTEAAHIDADDLLVEFLNKLGYTQLTNKFSEVSKWYA